MLMKRLTLIFLWLSFLSLVAVLPALAQDEPVECAGSLAPRLAVGDTGRIAEVFSTLRTNPAGFPIRIMFSPATFQVLEGPLCAGYGPLTWYKIQYENGAIGWAAESQIWSRWGYNHYWLEPADQDSFNSSFGTGGPVPMDVTQPAQPTQPTSTAASIKITNPLPEAIIDIAAPITITGNGSGLFEGNIVVRLVDDQSNVLAEQPTTLTSAGNWQVAIPVSIAAGTPGVIVAYAPSPTDGSVTAIDIINVTFGVPSTEPNFVKIGSPQTATGVPLDQPIVISGIADPRNGNIVRLEIVDQNGNMLLQQPVDIIPSPQGGFGTWEITVEIHGQAVGTQLQISAMTAPSFDAPALSSDAIGVVVIS
jgi:hypothetical protein